VSQQYEPYTGPPPTGWYRHPPVPPPSQPVVPFGALPPPEEQRPAVVTAAALLAWVIGGLMLVAAGLLFFGAAFLRGFDSVSGTGTNAYVTEFTADAIIDVIAAGLLISGGVCLANRNGVARLLTAAGAVVVLLEAFYWLTRWSGRFDGAIAGYAVIFGLLAAVLIGLTCSGAAGAWLRERAPAAPRD